MRKKCTCKDEIIREGQISLKTTKIHYSSDGRNSKTFYQICFGLRHKLRYEIQSTAALFGILHYSNRILKVMALVYITQNHHFYGP